jgi:hypothetical protein
MFALTQLQIHDQCSSHRVGRMQQRVPHRGHRMFLRIRNCLHFRICGGVWRSCDIWGFAVDVASGNLRASSSVVHFIGTNQITGSGSSRRNDLSHFISKGKSIQAINCSGSLGDVAGQQAVVVTETAICGLEIG